MSKQDDLQNVIVKKGRDLELGLMKQAVRAGLGISSTLESAVREAVRAGTIRARPVEETPLAKLLFSIFPEALSTASPTAQFVTFLQDAKP
jgi:DNA-binding transcriptional LysR family regulator